MIRREDLATSKERRGQDKKEHKSRCRQTLDICLFTSEQLSWRAFQICLFTLYEAVTLDVDTFVYFLKDILLLRPPMMTMAHVLWPSAEDGESRASTSSITTSHGNPVVAKSCPLPFLQRMTSHTQELGHIGVGGGRARART